MPDIRRVMMSKVLKRFCTEICKSEDCSKCQVSKLSEWVSRNIVVLYHFQIGWPFVANAKLDLLALFDLAKCKACESFKMNHCVGSEVQSRIEQVKGKEVEVVEIERPVEE